MPGEHLPSGEIKQTPSASLSVTPETLEERTRKATELMAHPPKDRSTSLAARGETPNPVVEFAEIGVTDNLEFYD